MKSIKRVLNLFVIAMVILYMFTITAGAAIDTRLETRAAYNNTALNLSGSWANSVYTNYSGYLFTDGGDISYAPGGLFGKKADDSAIFFKGGLLQTVGNPYDNGDNSTSFRYQFDIATKDGGSVSLACNTNLKINNVPGSNFNCLFEVKKNDSGVAKVYVFGQESDVVWTYETWHNFDIVVEQGDKPTLTVIMDGEQVTRSDTFDGVKTTADRVPISQYNGEEFDILYYKGMHFSSANPDKGFYLDNWHSTFWNNKKETQYASGNEYEYILENHDAEQLVGIIDSAMTPTIIHGAGANGDYVKVCKDPSASGYTRWLYQATRDDVTYRSSIDYMIPTKPNAFVIAFEHSGHYAQNVIGGDNFPFGALGTQTPIYDETWHTVEVNYNKKARTFTLGVDNTIYNDGAISNNGPEEFLEWRVFGESTPWYLDNYINKQVKTKPLISKASYSIEGVQDLTDDYKVPANVSSIKLDLTATIASVTTDTVKLYDDKGNQVGVNVELGDGKDSIIVSPLDELKPDTNYKVVLGNNLLCEDSTVGANEWKQTLDTTVVHNFKTTLSSFDWTDVQLMTAAREGLGTDESPYTWGTPVTYNGTYICDNTKVGAKITMTNTSGSDKLITVLVATYDLNGLLRSVKYENVVFENGGESSETVMSDPIGNSANMAIKVMCWDSITNMVPLTQIFNLYSIDNATNTYGGKSHYTR